MSYENRPMNENLHDHICDDIDSLPQHTLNPASKPSPGKLEGELTNTPESGSPSLMREQRPQPIYVNKIEGKPAPNVKKVDKGMMSPGRRKLYGRLNKQMKIEMTDGRILVGIFLCTDRDANIILGSCTEYLNPAVCGFTDEPRILGLVMVPGRHIVSIHHDASDSQHLIMSDDIKE